MPSPESWVYIVACEPCPIGGWQFLRRIKHAATAPSKNVPELAETAHDDPLIPIGYPTAIKTSAAMVANNGAKVASHGMP